jgi:cytoskeletal protein RodZ
MNSPGWCSGCNSQGACELRAGPGCQLTTLFRTDAVPSVTAIDAPAASKKNAWLPLLTVLFLISYGLMTMLIVEQGRTIESQRALIRELFRDSTELSSVKMKAVQDSAQSSSAKSQTPVTRNPSSQIPSSQIPSTQAPTTTQAPSSQAGPQQQRAQGKSTKQKPDFKMPSKPAADLVDDVRTLITI